MHTVIEQLPKAIRYSGILAVCFLILTVLFLLGFILSLVESAGIAIMTLIPLTFVAFQYWLFRSYNKACKQVQLSRNVDDLTLACRKQSAIIKFYGIFSLLLLILIVLGFFSGIGALNSLTQMM